MLRRLKNGNNDQPKPFDKAPLTGNPSEVMHTTQHLPSGSTVTLFRIGRAARALGFAVILGTSATVSGAEPVFQVNGSDELSAALKSSKPGTTLELAPGDFGVLKISGRLGGVNRPLTLRAADPNDPPRFSGMVIRNASNLILESLLFDYSYGTKDKSYFRPFQVIGSDSLIIKHSTFDGDVVAANSGQVPSPTAYGLTITDSKNVSILGNELRRFLRGMVVAQSNGIIVRGNEFHSLRMDGLNFAEVRDVLIENNNIHDFDRVLNSKDHADFIQFWTNRTKTPSESITIRGNILNSGDGWYTQSIFMRNDVVDRGLAGPEMFYRNVMIEDNVIINAHLHGITVGETDGLIIRNNSVIRNARSEGLDDNVSLWTPQIRVSTAAENVTISSNVTSKIVGFTGQSSWNLDNNFFIQDRAPESPGFYDQVFIAARIGDPSRLENFAPLPGGPLDGTRLGSPILRNFVGNLSTPLPAIKVAPDGIAPNRFSFDATLTLFPERSDRVSANYSWDMGDGTRLAGARVTHEYGTEGAYKVTLTIALPGREAVETSTTVSIPKSDVLALDRTTNALMAFASEVPLAITHPSISGGVIRLNPVDKPLTVSAALFAPVYGARDLALSFRLRGSGNYRNRGNILQIPKTFAVSVTGRGALNVDIVDSDGKMRNVKSPGSRLYEATWRDVVVRYSGKRQSISISIDGKTVAERPFSGLPSHGKWDMTFGSPLKDGVTFVGELSDLRLTINTE